MDLIEAKQSKETKYWLKVIHKKIKKRTLNNFRVPFFYCHLQLLSDTPKFVTLHTKEKATAFFVFILTLKYILHIALILFTIGNLAAQNESNKTQVIIKQADRLYRDDRVSDAQVLQGNVIFEHDGALMYCDSALIFQEE